MTSIVSNAEPQSFQDDRGPCLVALVGFPAPLPIIARGILERCALKSIECPTVSRGCQLLQTVAVDAIVLDTHSSELQDLSRPLLMLLALSVLAPGSKPGYPSLVVLGSSKITPALRKALSHAKAVFLPTERQNYRQIAKVIRQHCGLPAGCCA